jgi:hypothetical protein
MKICYVLMLILFVSGCDEAVKDSLTKKEYYLTDTFNYLYWHEDDKHTLFTVNKDLSISKLTIGNNRLFDKNGKGYHVGNVKLFVDLKDNQKPWYLCKLKLKDHRIYWFCDIHITDIDDMKEAGWNHGKYGSGSTTRLQ